MPSSEDWQTDRGRPGGAHIGRPGRPPSTVPSVATRKRGVWPDTRTAFWRIGRIAAALTIMAAAAPPIAPAALTADSNGNAVARAAIHREIPAAHHLYVACTTDVATAVRWSCRATWTAHRRRYLARLHLTPYHTTSAKTWRYRIYGRSLRAGHHPAHLDRHGTITITILPGSSRGNPIPLGAPASIRDWTITVLNATPDATAAVLAENEFNDPPAAGHQYYMVHITATYNGPASDSYDADYEMRAVGQSNVGYSTFSNDCGVIPDAFPDTADVFTEGTVSGNICWSIDSQDADSLVMYRVGFLEEDPPVFFALR